MSVSNIGALDPSAWSSSISNMVDTLKGSTAASRAADSDRQLAQDELNYSINTYWKNQNDFAPYQTLGTNAVSSMTDLMNGNTSAIYSNPFYKAITEPATKSYNSALAHSGLLGSGQAATGYADIANSGLTDYYNKLIDQIKIGTGAASSAGSSIGSTLNGVSNATNTGSNANWNEYSGNQSLYNQQQNTGYNNLSTGTKIYDWGKNNGWWGSGSGNSSNDGWSTTSGDNGDISYFGNGQLWD